MSGLTFIYPPQEPEYTPTPNPAPTIVTTVQQTPLANVATYVSNFLPQILTIMQTNAGTYDSDADVPNRRGGEKQSTATPALARQKMNQDIPRLVC